MDGINIGRKIWNLDHAIWPLQGRHRDMVHFAEYIYETPSYMWYSRSRQPLIRKNGRWTFGFVTGRKLIKEQFEKFKTRFYKLQGWDTSLDYPNRPTLESIGLGRSLKGVNL